MNLAQCNALISLPDDRYYERAWCSLESMMIQGLKLSYNMHEWWEHVAPQLTDDREGSSENWGLRAGPVDLKIVMADKELTFEEDRAKVLFLERQSKLLGWT